MRKLALPYIMTFFGSLLATVGINAFFIPHNLLSSGIGGIAIMIYYALGLPVGMMLLILNIPVMIACYKFMGRQYTLLSVIGTFMFSFLIDSTSFLSTMEIIRDPMVSTITGGGLTGIGMGLMYRYNGNSGGLDVVAAILKKYYSLEMGSAVMGINAIIIACAAYMFGLELAVLTFVGVYVAGVVTNKVVMGINQRKTAMIISSHPDEIAAVIIRYIGRGVTLIYGEGAFTHQEKKIVYVVINLTQVSKLKEIVNKVDNHAFMSISDTSDVFGYGFTMPNKNRRAIDSSLAMPKIKNPLPPEG